MITLLTLIFLYFFKIDFLYLQIFNVVFYFYATLLYFNEHENKYEIHTNFNYYYKEPFYFLEPKPKFKKIRDKFDPQAIRQNALKFSKERFEREIKRLVEDSYERFLEGEL